MARCFIACHAVASFGALVRVPAFFQIACAMRSSLLAAAIRATFSGFPRTELPITKTVFCPKHVKPLRPLVRLLQLVLIPRLSCLGTLVSSCHRRSRALACRHQSDTRYSSLGNRRKRRVLRFDRKSRSDMKTQAKVVTKERELDLRPLASHIEATTRCTHLTSLMDSGSSKLAFEFRCVL